ncbi:NAD(P)H-dependent oxidoreductase [Pseudonocardia eucalypti]|uniref:NAD(P)H-dependent oxidoreductase n=1 Tax=Pseudonocardia eucalypti TaxID=648755 RepID=A0ABP9R7I1_9PSEU|nr:NAD(P)H-dependent FMN reductase [Pseudonocardia eucalypti]
MTENPIKVAVIIGSTREGRAGATIARWFLTQAQQRADIDLDVIDLVDESLPVHHPAEVTAATAAYTRRIDQADAFVVVTPEYNHSYPAALKHAIDLVHAEWFAKPVGFVSYGGMAQGLRAVEHLRGVFAELHAVTMRDGVSVNLFDGGVDDNGWVRDSAGAGRAAKTMLDQLTWWAHALRDARAVRPYAG